MKKTTQDTGHKKDRGYLGSNTQGMIYPFIMLMVLMLFSGISYAQTTNVAYTLSSPQVNISGTSETVPSALVKPGNVPRWMQTTNGYTSVTFALMDLINGLSTILSIQKTGVEQLQQYNFTIIGITYQ